MYLTAYRGWPYRVPCNKAVNSSISDFFEVKNDEAGSGSGFENNVENDGSGLGSGVFDDRLFEVCLKS